MLLRDLRINKIEWTAVDTICTLRFSFNNGTTSMQLGNRFPAQNEFKVPQETQIKMVKIAVRGKSEFLEAINFYDSKRNLILGIRGHTVKGEWETLALNADQHLVGIKGNMCDNYIRGIMFFVWSNGMGVKGQERWAAYHENENDLRAIRRK